MSLRQTIESAFESVGYPGDLNIIHCVCPICRSIVVHFRGTKWQVHNLDSLRKHQLAISLFTPEAFHYFLPAYMLNTAGAWGETCLIPFLITKQFLPLRPEEEPKRHQYHAKRTALFSPPQRTAIVTYLRDYAASGTALVTDDIMRAIAQIEALSQPPPAKAKP